ncbi:MAG: 3-phosphoshikimate 1-carboxyvinyltransferase, partial [Woeseiaceae bacterium]
SREIQRLGGEVVVDGDEIRITPRPLHSGEIDSHGDHRIAMSLAVAGSVASDEVTVKDVDSVETSFPGFAATMTQLGLSIQ